MKLTKKQKDQVSSFVLRVKDDLGMKDKDFYIDFETNIVLEEEECAATAFEGFGSCDAFIRINESWFAKNWNNKAHFIKKTLIHEVCHIMLFQYENAALTIIDELANDSTIELYKRQLVQHSEITVDRLANALAHVLTYNL